LKLWCVVGMLETENAHIVRVRMVGNQEDNARQIWPLTFLFNFHVWLLMLSLCHLNCVCERERVHDLRKMEKNKVEIEDVKCKYIVVVSWFKGLNF